MEGRALGIVCWCHQPRALPRMLSTALCLPRLPWTGQAGAQHKPKDTPRHGNSPVFSGMEAWSVFLSFLKEMFPNCSTEDTTLSMAVIKRDIASVPWHRAQLNTFSSCFLCHSPSRLQGERSSGRTHSLCCAFWANGLNSTPVGVKQTFSSGCQKQHYIW